MVGDKFFFAQILLGLVELIAHQQDCLRKVERAVLGVEGNIDDETCELTLQFLSDLGLIQVVITDDSGNPIYQESVEAEAGQIVSILLDELPAQGQMISVNDGNNVVYGFIN